MVTSWFDPVCTRFPPEDKSREKVLRSAFCMGSFPYTPEQELSFSACSESRLTDIVTDSGMPLNKALLNIVKACQYPTSVTRKSGKATLHVINYSGA